MDPQAPQQPSPTPAPSAPQNPYARGNSFSRPTTNQPQVPISTAQPQLSSIPPSNKKSKVWVVVAIIVLLAAAIISAVVIISASLKENALLSDSTNYVSDAKIYVNYLIYGESTESDIEETYSLGNRYEMDRKLTAPDQERLEYFDNLLNYLAAIRDKLLNDNNIDTTIKDDVNKYYERVSLYRLLGIAGVATVDNIFKSYLSQGVDATIQNINNKYSGIINGVDSDYGAYAQALIDITEFYLTLFSAYEESGCIVNQVIDTQCTSALIYGSDIFEEQMSEIATVIEESDGIIDQKRDDILYGAFWLLGQLNSARGAQ